MRCHGNCCAVLICVVLAIMHCSIEYNGMLCSIKYDSCLHGTAWHHPNGTCDVVLPAPLLGRETVVANELQKSIIHPGPLSRGAEQVLQRALAHEKQPRSAEERGWCPGTPHGSPSIPGDYMDGTLLMV